MPRVAGVDIPNEKRVDIALTSIYGVGLTTATKVAEAAQVSIDSKVRDLSEDDLNRVREVIDKEYLVEGDLRRQVQQNIRRLVEVNTYRGVRAKK